MRDGGEEGDSAILCTNFVLMSSVPVQRARKVATDNALIEADETRIIIVMWKQLCQLLQRIESKSENRRIETKTTRKDLLLSL